MLDGLLASGFPFIALLVFIATVLLVEAIYLLWKSAHGTEARKLSRRLQALASDAAPAGRARVLRDRSLSEIAAVNQWLSSMERARGAQNYLNQADVGFKVVPFALLSAGLGVLAFVLVQSVAPGLLLPLTAAALAGSIPGIVVAVRRSRRLAKIEAQLPDALDLMTRALKAGHSFATALLMTGEELPDPIGAEFRTVHDEITFGISTEDALTHLSERLPITDIRYFVVAVLIQRDSGGNLTEVLSNLSRLVRERHKLLSKVRILSADGRFSAWILALMPFALGGIMYLVNGAFMSLLWTDPLGQSILQTLAWMMVAGILILRRIVRIRV